MANRYYDKGIEAYLEGSIASLSDTLKANLISSASYTPNFTTDQFLAIIPGGAIIAAGVALTSKSGSAGALSAANTVWTAVTGAAAAYIGLYKDTGSSATSPLICLIDTGTGLPVTPNGGDITAAWASGIVYTLKAGLSAKEQSLVERLWRALGIGADAGDQFGYIPEPTVTVGRQPYEPSRLWMPAPAF